MRYPVDRHASRAHAVLASATGAKALGSLALRYFDPEGQRAGVPADVAALVTAIAPDGVNVTAGEHRPGHA